MLTLIRTHLPHRRIVLRYSLALVLIYLFTKALIMAYWWVSTAILFNEPDYVSREVLKTNDVYTMNRCAADKGVPVLDCLQKQEPSTVTGAWRRDRLYLMEQTLENRALIIKLRKDNIFWLNELWNRDKESNLYKTVIELNVFCKQFKAIGCVRLPMFDADEHAAFVVSDR